MKFDGFITILIKVLKLERYKNSYVQPQRLSESDINLTRVEWVFVEKNRFYKLFPIQKVISFTLICALIRGAILIFHVPPEYGIASASSSRGFRYWPVISILRALKKLELSQSKFGDLPWHNITRNSTAVLSENSPLNKQIGHNDWLWTRTHNETNFFSMKIFKTVIQSAKLNCNGNLHDRHCFFISKSSFLWVYVQHVEICQ